MKTSLELNEDNEVELYLKLTERELDKFRLKSGPQPEGIFHVIIEAEEDDE